MLGSVVFAADADFVVTPRGVVTALKGRWGWLAVGVWALRWAPSR